MPVSKSTDRVSGRNIASRESKCLSILRASLVRKVAAFIMMKEVQCNNLGTRGCCHTGDLPSLYAVHSLGTRFWWKQASLGSGSPRCSIHGQQVIRQATLHTFLLSKHSDSWGRGWLPPQTHRLVDLLIESFLSLLSHIKYIFILCLLKKVCVYTSSTDLFVPKFCYFKVCNYRTKSWGTTDKPMRICIFYQF